MNQRNQDILLTDKYYDVKALTIPVIEKKHIKNVILNTLRKELSIELNQGDIDYELL